MRVSRSVRVDYFDHSTQRLMVTLFHATLALCSFHETHTFLVWLLLPAVMKLLGDANWWMPKWTGTVLRIPHREPPPEIAPESA
ncbi:MAG TPA: hypothetical protein VIL77_05545 [Gaiellaceae bacterium]